MPKRVPQGEIIDPVRSRLAASAAAPAAPATPRAAAPEIEAREREAEQGSAPAPSQQRRATKFVSRDRLTTHRKVMFTPEEAERNEETTAMIAAAFGNKATYSQVSRAMWSVLTQAEESLKANGKRAKRIPYPSKGDHVAMAEYEEALAEFIALALRRQ